MPKLPKRKIGRPSGKRTDPNYTQITLYVLKSTHHGVKLALLTQGKGLEISELAEELFAGWLKRHP